MFVLGKYLVGISTVCLLCVLVFFFMKSDKTLVTLGDCCTADPFCGNSLEILFNVVDCIVMKDPKTSKSRGFGFVTFERLYMVNVDFN